MTVSAASGPNDSERPESERPGVTAREADRQPTSGGQALLLLGVATMVPQLVWARQLGEVVGSDLEGISITLALYLLGAAVGLELSARRVWSPRGWTLLALVALGCGTLWCHSWAPALTAGWRGTQWPLVQVLLALPVAPYALALSAAIPAWFREPLRPEEGVARRAGVWIAALDVGSAAGALLTPLLLLPWVGPLPSLVTAGLCLLATTLLPQPTLPQGAGALFGSRRSSPALREAESPGPNAPPRLSRGTIAFAVGLVSFALQVVWTRLLGEVLGTSLLVLGIAAAALLLGGALGSRTVPRLLKISSRETLLWICWWGWLAGQLTSAYLMAKLPFIYLRCAEWLGPDASLTPLKTALVTLVLLPPAFCAGFPVPVLAAGWSRGASELARETGRLQALVLAGGMVGALGMGLWLIPLAGSGGSLVVSAVVTALGAVGTAFLVRSSAASLGSIVRSIPGLSLIVIVGITAFASARSWDPTLLGAGVFQWSREDIAGGDALAGWRQREVLYTGEGRLARVTIEQSRELNTSFLKVGGRVEGTVPVVEGEPTLADLPTQVLLGVLPVLARGPGGRVLVVGVGGGTTVASAVEANRSPEGQGPPADSLVTAVEVEPEVLAALRSPGGRKAFPWETERLFPEAESGPRLVVGDARAFLHGSSEKWDAIVCQPSEPWLPWSAPLFTRRFYERVDSCLSDGGVAVQWLQLYRIDVPEFASILREFHSVFPEVLIFHPHPRTGEVLLVGGGREPELKLWVERWNSPGVRVCRERVDWPDEAVPVPLLDPAGVNRWLERHPPASSAVRERLEHRLPLLADRGTSYAREILRSLVDAARESR